MYETDAAVDDIERQRPTPGVCGFAGNSQDHATFTGELDGVIQQALKALSNFLGIAYPVIG